MNRKLDQIDTTELEIHALRGAHNLSDAHTHQSQSITQANIILDLPKLWYATASSQQQEEEKRFIRSFFSFRRQFSAMNSSAMLVYSASVAMMIVAILAKKRGGTVSLIEPCFDNIPDLLGHMDVPLRPLRESALAGSRSPADALSGLQPGDMLFLVQPNNPTGFSRFLKTKENFTELVRISASRRIVLVLDVCFAAFITYGCREDSYDMYEILNQSDVDYICIEDTGKIWPHQDAKVSLLLVSESLREHVRAIHTSVLLNVSPFILRLTSEYATDSELDRFSSMLNLVSKNRTAAGELLAGSILELMPSEVELSVAWFKIASWEATASQIYAAAAKAGIHILPGTHFFWFDKRRGERFVRLALARDSQYFAKSVEALRGFLDQNFQPSQLRDMKGVWAPLVTPFFDGYFDANSLIKLMEATRNFVDGYFVGLSTGEGWKLSHPAWEALMRTAVGSSELPIIAGIMHDSDEASIRCLDVAASVGCAGAAIRCPSGSPDYIVDWFARVVVNSRIPLVLYFTEERSVSDIQALKALASMKGVIAIKDSTNDQVIVRLSHSVPGGLGVKVLQGLEHHIATELRADGCVLSLANTHPELCRRCWDERSSSLVLEFLGAANSLNLKSSNWFAYIKAALYGGGTLRSGELISEH